MLIFKYDISQKNLYRIRICFKFCFFLQQERNPLRGNHLPLIGSHVANVANLKGGQTASQGPAGWCLVVRVANCLPLVGACASVSVATVATTNGHLRYSSSGHRLYRSRPVTCYLVETLDLIIYSKT